MTIGDVPQTQDSRSGAASSGSSEARKLGVLGPYLFIATLGWGIPSTAMPTLAQALIAQVDPANKIALVALVSTVASVLGVIVAFTVGGLSDRTRSRFGARKPWILGTAIFSAVSALLVLVSGSFAVFAVSFVAFEIGLAAMVVSLSALLPDHVPAEKLGRASSLIGLGSLLGLATGGGIASLFITMPRVGLAVIPLLMVVVAVIGWFAIPKSSTVERTKEPLDVIKLLAGLRPPADRDFWLVFGGRLAFLLALLTVTGYQLFVLTDYYGATAQQAGQIIALAGLILAAGAALSTAAFGWLSDRTQRRKPFIIGAGAVLAIALVLLLTSNTPTAFLLYSTVASIAYGTYISVDQALMVQVLPTKDEAAKDLGFLTVANTAPGIVAPGLAAVLVSIGGYPAVFIGAIVIALASIGFVLLIKRVR